MSNEAQKSVELSMNYDQGHGVSRRGEELTVDLLFPPYEGDQNPEHKVRYVVVGLEHVRAADDVRVSYDFGRNGWVIQQAQVFSWPCDDTVCDPEWKEVAFVPAWGSERDPS